MEKQLRIIKFKNINGHTCYINSIINILYQTEYLQHFILIDNRFNINYIFDNIKDIFVDSWNNKGCVIKPLKLLNNLHSNDERWYNGSQQDSHEFLNFILDKLSIDTIEINKYFSPKYFINKKINFNHKIKIFNILNIICLNIYINNICKCCNSYIFNIFTSYYQYKYLCKYCKTTSIIVENNNILLLNIITSNKNNDNNDIYNLLDKHFDNEKLCKHCDFCGYKNIVHSKKKTIWITSNILIIGLTRFLVIYKNGIIIKKNNKYIKYPTRLDISKYYDIESPYKYRYIYELYAINLHIDNFDNIDSGHYISIIKTLKTNKWILYDDENIKKINNIEELQNKYTYILFYALI